MPRDRIILESALLAVRWQRGDRSSFDGIVELWERPLFYYLRRLAASEEDAWELLQEAWLKVVKSLGTLRDPHTLPAFLYTTARNTALSRMRGRVLETNYDFADNLLDDRSIDDHAALENAEEVHRALDQLPLAQREALTLHYLQDLSLDDIASVLNVPLGTVKSRLFYAKRALRDILTTGENHAR
ncbi:MAG: RNA polymerase sigma factor [Pirellulales bacterium]